MDEGNGDPRGFSIIAEKTVPDAYADSVAFEVNLWGFTLEFGKTQRPPANFKGKLPAIPRFRIHMSPQHTKAMAVLLTKNVRIYESQFGKIELPRELYKEWGVEEE